ncbi:RNA polymerase sigma factor [Terrimonas sp.]|uniref:RNA polymerase sigma factor n=1 Tax=Terrimonas sp. TaxID=1914338 RepID=UPI001056EF26|nr:RNA polymerase sigma-70 factor [Terrimonas sp.]
MDQLACIPELQQKIALYDDMKAYRNLCDLFYNRLYRTAFTFIKSKESAEEIVSDVFIKVWQMRVKLAEIENLSVYLYTVTKNLCLKYITRQYKNPVINLDEIAFETTIDFKTPEEICISSDITKKIREALNELPPKCRLILQLVKEDGLRYKEVAAILNISELTVRNQLAIAVKKLGKVLPVYLESYDHIAVDCKT